MLQGGSHAVMAATCRGSEDHDVSALRLLGPARLMCNHLPVDPRVRQEILLPVFSIRFVSVPNTHSYDDARGSVPRPSARRTGPRGCPPVVLPCWRTRSEEVEIAPVHLSQPPPPTVGCSDAKVMEQQSECCQRAWYVALC